MGAKSRRKGVRGERSVSVIMRRVFPHAARRASAEEGQGTNLGRDLVGVDPFCAQVQLSGNPTIERKYTEAARAAGEKEIPIAITRRSSRSKSGTWLVTLSLNDLLDILEAGYEVSAERCLRDYEDGA